MVFSLHKCNAYVFVQCVTANSLQLESCDVYGIRVIQSTFSWLINVIYMLITIRSTYIYYSTTIQYQIQYYYTSWEKWKSNLIMRREEKMTETW